MLRLIKLYCGIVKCKLCPNRMQSCHLIDGMCPSCHAKQQK